MSRMGSQLRSFSCMGSQLRSFMGSQLRSFPWGRNSEFLIRSITSAFMVWKLFPDRSGSLFVEAFRPIPLYSRWHTFYLVFCLHKKSCMNMIYQYLMNIIYHQRKQHQRLAAKVARKHQETLPETSGLGPFALDQARQPPCKTAMLSVLPWIGCIWCQPQIKYPDYQVANLRQKPFWTITAPPICKLWVY